MQPSHGPWKTFLRLWLLAQAVFWPTWQAAYHWLPEGFLRGVGAAANVPLEHLPFWSRFLGISGYNLVVIGAVGAMNLLRWGPVPTGFIPVLGYWIHYGLLLGSNSFAVPLEGRLAPSIMTLLGRSGFYELTAYLMMGAATAQWARWQQTGLWGGCHGRL